MNANVDWIVLSDRPAVATGAESPGLTDDFNTGNDTKKIRLRYSKRVVFYTMTDTGGSSTLDNEDSTRVYEMGHDDGTIAQVGNRGRFNVEVTNEPATASGGGSGTSSAE